jgi:hypothetical protein
MKSLQDFANKGQPKLPATTPTMNVATSEQIHTLLHVCASMAPFLMGPPEDTEKEARLSASTTVLRATDRLERILAEDKRWAVGEYDEVVKNLNAMYKSQTKYMEDAGKRDRAEARRSQAMAKPHNMRKVGVFSLNNGEWLVVEGDPSNKATIKATGASPIEAADNFDKIWNGEEPYQPFSVAVVENLDQASDEVGGGLQE